MLWTALYSLLLWTLCKSQAYDSTTIEPSLNSPSKGAVFCETAKGKQEVIYAQGNILKDQTTSIIADLGSILDSTGHIVSLFCGRRVIGIQYQTTQWNRLYFYDTMLMFNRQNYITMPSTLVQIYGLAFRGGVLLLHNYDSSGNVMIQFNPVLGGYFDQTKTVTLLLSGMCLAGSTPSSTPMMIFGENTNFILIYGERQMVRVLLTPAGQLSLDDSLLNAFIPDQTIAIIPNSLDPNGLDIFFVLYQSKVSKSLLSASPLRIATLSQASSDNGISTFGVLYTEINYLLVTSSTSGINIWNDNILLYSFNQQISGLLAVVYPPTSSPRKASIYFVESQTGGILVLEKITPTQCSQNCLSCLSSTICYGSCVNSHFLQSDNSCVLGSSQDGWGKNMDEMKIYPCLTAQCKDCKDDYKVCTQCSLVDSTTQSTLYLINSQTSPIAACTISIPNGYGPTTTISTTLTNCQDLNCILCSSEFSQCTKCVTPYWAKSLTPDSCYSETSIPAGWGKSLTVPQTLEKCMSQYCTNCRDRPSVCTLCSDGMIVRIEILGSVQSCVSPLAQDNKGYGAIVDSLLNSKPITKCTEDLCEDCFLNNKICIKCEHQTSSGDTIYQSIPADLNGQVFCKTQLQLPPGNGIVPNTFTYTSCVDSPRCQNCNNNNENCEACDISISSFVYPRTTGGICLTITEVSTLSDPLAKAYGVKGKLFLPCPNYCLSCYSDSNICIQCQEGYYVDSTLYTPRVCLPTTSIPPRMGLKTGTTTIEPCTDLLCQSCAKDSSICLQCIPTAYFYHIDKLVSGEQPLVCAKGDNIPPSWGRDLANPTLLLLQQCTFGKLSALIVKFVPQIIPTVSNANKMKDLY